MKVFYIHHGQRKRTKRAGLEDDLTVLGEKDAALTGKLLSCYKERVRAIYTSNFFRCKKTAQIINQNFGVEIIEESRLNEFGSLKGESWTELQRRIMDFLDEICQTYNDDDIVFCVTSGVNIVGFINKAYGLAPSENAPFLPIISCSPVGFEFKKHVDK